MNKAKPKKILIDVDDVIITDTENVYLKVLNNVFGTNLKTENLTSYHVEDYQLEDHTGLTQEQKIYYYQELRKFNAYENAVISQECIDTIKRLNQVHNVYICSAVTFRYKPEESAPYFKYKYDFLKKFLPFLNPKNFIFTSAKTMLDADVLIVDRPSNLMGEGIKTKLLFTAFHNKAISKDELDRLNFTRVNNWQEVERILL